MNEEVYAFILKNGLNEVKNTCPDVAHTFVFEEDGKILAKDENTDEVTIKSVIGVFDPVVERAKTMGGLESITFNSANGRVNIAFINNFYLTTIASKDADEKYVNILVRLWVPAMLTLIEKIRLASTEDEVFSNLKAEPFGDHDVKKVAEGAKVGEKDLPVEKTNVTVPELELIEKRLGSQSNSNPLLRKPPVNQLMVENLGGLLVPSDTVRIDTAVITHWNDLYADKRIEEVRLETLTGKATHCRFKPIKDSKHEGKGIVQIPEKLQHALQTKEGELVMVKPMVE